MAPSGKRVLFAILPVLVLVGAVELAATVHRIVSCPGAPPTFAVPNVQYGWLHPADTTVRAWGCAGSTYEWANEVRFNSHGLVGPDVPHERRPGVPRVLVLGDSVAEAMQVPPGADFSSRLRQRFAESGRRVEIVNAGHSGFGTDNELLFYEAEGRRYRPDIVLLELNLQNDFAENSPAIVRRMYLHGPDHPKADLTLLDEEQIDVDPRRSPRRRSGGGKTRGDRRACSRGFADIRSSCGDSTTSSTGRTMLRRRWIPRGRRRNSASTRRHPMTNGRRPRA